MDLINKMKDESPDEAIASIHEYLKETFIDDETVNTPNIDTAYNKFNGAFQKNTKLGIFFNRINPLLKAHIFESGYNEKIGDQSPYESYDDMRKNIVNELTKLGESTDKLQGHATDLQDETLKQVVARLNKKRKKVEDPIPDVQEQLIPDAAPLFEEAPIVETKIDLTRTSMRPTFKNNTLEDAEKTWDEEVDVEGIKEESVKFNYVDINGWRTKGNSLYETQVIHQRMMYPTPKHDGSQLFLPKQVKISEKQPEYNLKLFKFPSLDVPMRVSSGGLYNNISFVKSHQKLNNSLSPVDISNVLLRKKTYKGSLYTPNPENVQFVKENKIVHPVPKPDDGHVLLSAVGMGTYDFDPFLRV